MAKNQRQLNHRILLSLDNQMNNLDTTLARIKEDTEKKELTELRLDYLERLTQARLRSLDRSNDMAMSTLTDCLFSFIGGGDVELDALAIVRFADVMKEMLSTKEEIGRAMQNIDEGTTEEEKASLFPKKPQALKDLDAKTTM